MIKLENVVLASPEQMEFIIEGMRNPMNSWDKGDSQVCNYMFKGCCGSCGKENHGCRTDSEENDFYLGTNDYFLMQKLSKAGTDHRKYMRMMPVYVRITAPLYWWKEFDTYKVGTVTNSCSTMHKIAAKEFTMEDFSTEHLADDPSLRVLDNVLYELNAFRGRYLDYDELSDTTKNKLNYDKKDIWWQMIQLLPSSYNQTRNVMMNYEVLSNIYKSRSGHKLDEWREFCRWIETLPYSELIMRAAGMNDNSINAKQGLLRHMNREDTYDAKMVKKDIS